MWFPSLGANRNNKTYVAQLQLMYTTVLHIHAGNCWQIFSQNSDLEVETESLRMYGWIWCYRNVNNGERLSFAVYNSYQNAIIPQRQKPVSLSTEQLQVSSFDDSMKSLLGGFCSFEQRSVMFVFWDHKKEPSSSDFTCCFSAAANMSC